ncbi:hypothetical protein DAVIS_05398 [Mycobacterium marinum]|uniref:Uncharacterized protein n=1 Tax=Mycobacterium marinum TaxID=1781 RepID=A0A3E2MMX2_MYCMR|nr:hypothetical protein [Mycobacterium marinum]RFZ32251.1 hypothetical protein DAVIS_05398 [Mycobacterium marinum]
MTFAIAAVLTDDDGRIVMFADTKLTISGDATRTRHIYSHPCLKTVIVDDDIAVSFSGQNPCSSHKLRETSVARTMVIGSRQKFQT